MTDLDQLAEQALSGTPSTAAKKAYELRAGADGDVLATVAWQRGTLAVADHENFPGNALF